MISKLINLGALTEKDEYILPICAIKKYHYKCPDCKNVVILKKGCIRRPHFAHIQSEHKCNFYEKIGESWIHKHAKVLLKYVIEHKDVNIIQICKKCNKSFNYKIFCDNTNSVEIECRFEFNGIKIADVAIINNDELQCIFEIFNKHKTDECDRPEPWFEFDAESIIEKCDTIDTNNISLSCIREYCCKRCSKFNKLDSMDLNTLLSNKYNTEWYIRYLLGQKSIITYKTYKKKYGSLYYDGINKLDDNTFIDNDILQNAYIKVDDEIFIDNFDLQNAYTIIDDELYDDIFINNLVSQYIYTKVDDKLYNNVFINNFVRQNTHIRINKKYKKFDYMEFSEFYKIYDKTNRLIINKFSKFNTNTKTDQKIINNFSKFFQYVEFEIISACDDEYVLNYKIIIDENIIENETINITTGTGRRIGDRDFDQSETMFVIKYLLYRILSNNDTIKKYTKKQLTYENCCKY